VIEKFFLESTFGILNSALKSGPENDYISPRRNIGIGVARSGAIVIHRDPADFLAHYDELATPAFLLLRH
jgi:hypothetical protein